MGHMACWYIHVHASCCMKRAHLKITMVRRVLDSSLQFWRHGRSCPIAVKPQSAYSGRTRQEHETAVKIKHAV